MLADFRIFIVRLSSKFVIESYLNIPPRLRHVATLSCEISVFKKNRHVIVIEANYGVRLTTQQTASKYLSGTISTI